MSRKLSGYKPASKEEIKEASRHSNGFTSIAMFPWSPGGFHRTVIYKVMVESFLFQI